MEMDYIGLSGLFPGVAALVRFPRLSLTTRKASTKEPANGYRNDHELYQPADRVRHYKNPV